MLRQLIKIWHALNFGIIVSMFVIGMVYLGLNPISLTQIFSAQISKAFGNDTRTSATVTPNQYNTLADQLSRKEEKLNEREDDLKDLKNSLGLDVSSIKKWILYLIPAVVALFVLIFLNFFFDKKERELLKKIEKDEKRIIEAEMRIEEKLKELK